MKRKIVLLSVVLFLGIPTIVSFTGCAGDRYSRSTGEFIDDKALVRRVRGALGDNPEYKLDDVNVNAFRGTIQLTGFVNTPEIRTQAASIASKVTGVREVQNSILVKP